MIKLIEDIESLTNVSESTLKKLLNVSTYCIGHAVHETQVEHVDITEIDLEIGELHIKVSDGAIKYRFIPSKELEDLISKTVSTGTSPIAMTIDSKLQEKIDKAYKELL